MLHPALFLVALPFSRSLPEKQDLFWAQVVVCSPNLLLRSHFALILALIEAKLCLSSRSMLRHSEHRVGMSSTRELFPGARMLMGGDLVTQSVVSISIFMHPLNVDCFRILISSRSMIRYLQRRESWWLAIWSLQRWLLQNIDLSKVYDSISSTQSEYQQQSRMQGCS